MAIQPIGINRKAGNLAIISYQIDLHTSGVARGGGPWPPKLLVNVSFRNELMLLRGLNV